MASSATVQETIVAAIVGVAFVALLVSWARANCKARVLPEYRYVLAELRRARGESFVYQLIMRELLLANAESNGPTAYLREAPEDTKNGEEPDVFAEEIQGREKNFYNDVAAKPVTRAAKRRNKQLRRLGAARTPPGTIDVAKLQLASQGLKIPPTEARGPPQERKMLSLAADVRGPLLGREVAVDGREPLLGRGAAAEEQKVALPNGGMIVVRAPPKPELPPPKPKTFDWKQEVAGIDGVWLPHARDAMKDGAPIDFVASRAGDRSS